MHFAAPFAVLATLSLALASPLELEKRTTGDITYYDANGIGACGTNTAGQLVAALSESVFTNAKCGNKLKVTNSANGKSVIVKIEDKCPGCVRFSFLLASDDVYVHRTPLIHLPIISGTRRLTDDVSGETEFHAYRSLEIGFRQDWKGSDGGSARDLGFCLRRLRF